MVTLNILNVNTHIFWRLLEKFHNKIVLFWILLKILIWWKIKFIRLNWQLLKTSLPLLTSIIRRLNIREIIEKGKIISLCKHPTIFLSFIQLQFYFVWKKSIFVFRRNLVNTSTYSLSFQLLSLKKNCFFPLYCGTRSVHSSLPFFVFNSQRRKCGNFLLIVE